MADTAVEVEADGIAVRVTEPDRIIFPPDITKLGVVEYYVAVGPGILRALRERPVTLERWPKGVHPGMVLARASGPMTATASTRSA